MKVGLGIAKVVSLLFTALIIAALIVAGAATVVGGGLVFAKKRNALGSGHEPKLLGTGANGDLLERSFTDMRLGDVVMHDGKDYIVEGLIRYDEAGHKWSMARIVDAESSKWLLVGLERTGGSSKRFLAPTTEVELAGYPPELLIVGDERYNFDKRGTATTSLEGDTGSLGGGAQTPGTGAAHRCRWWSYTAAGPSALLVEQWGDDYRVLIGKTVNDSEIEMMPGS